MFQQEEQAAKSDLHQAMNQDAEQTLTGYAFFGKGKGGQYDKSGQR